MDATSRDDDHPIHWRPPITPIHPLRSNAPDPDPDIITFAPPPPEAPGTTAPRTPRSSHSRKHSESRGLLSPSKNLFEYSATTQVHFRDVELQDAELCWGWTGEPQYLRKTKKELFRETVTSLLVIALPMPFFALAGAVLRVNGKALEGKHEEIFRQCIWLAATLLPFIFAFVLGRLSVKLSSYIVERGTNLDILERLMGSRTFFGTLMTQFCLGPYNIIAIAFMFIWFLSPAGSQAILRTLVIESKGANSNTTITYFNTRQPSYAGNSRFGAWFSGFSALFSASLLAPESVKTGKTDLWGNIIIPRLKLLSDLDSDGWLEYPPNSTQAPSSLFGISLSPLPNGTSNFTVESSYLQLACNNITSNITRNSSAPNYTFFDPGLVSPSGPFVSGLNATEASTTWVLGYVGHDVSSLLPPPQNTTPSLDALPSTANDNFFPGILLFQDFTGWQNVTSIYCMPAQVYVESAITCSSPLTGDGNVKSCSVTKQRPSTLPHPPTSLTLLSFQNELLSITALLQQIAPSRNGVDILQNYLFSPLNNSFIQSAQPPRTQAQESRFLNLPLGDFENRLAAVLNAFFQGSQGNATLYLTGSPLPEPFVLDPATGVKDLVSTLGTAATTLSSRRVFTYSTPWLTLYLLTLFTMILAALVSGVLQHLTMARDYLPFVSSLVRESEAGMPGGGVALHGLARSRKLGKLRVRLGEVGDADGLAIGIGAALSVGRFGIGGREVRGAEMRKLYV